jgi:hypothetical protein
MQTSPKRKIQLPLIIALSFILILGGIFVIRAPVLIVTDASFSQLYGPGRLRQRQWHIALNLFRQVITVTVSEHAGSDHVAFAVEETFGYPKAVLFPYRYLAGARHYRQNNPDIPVLVMLGGRSKPDDETDLGIIYVLTDSATDLYRAGLSAALLAGEKRTLIFDDELFPEENRELLREMLEQRGFLLEPLFLSPSAHYSRWADIGCVIMTGPASRFLEQGLDIQVILFSWVDPAITPNAVKIIFDDSPWAIAARAVKSIGSGDIIIPSAPAPFFDRMEDRANFRIIRGILKEEF